MKMLLNGLFCMVLALSLAVPMVGYGEEEEGNQDGLISQILDSAKPCLLIDLKETRLLGGVTASMIDYRGLVSLDIGAITDLNSSALLVGLSGNVQGLAEKYGLNFNLPEKVGVGCYLARDFGEREFMYGLSLSYTISW